MDLQKKRRRFAIVMAGGRGGRRVPRIALSANTVTEGASVNTVIGALSVVNPLDGDPTGWTFTETADPDTKFNISSANLRTSGTWAYTPSTTAYSVTITASKSGQTDIVQTFSVNVLAVLGNLALDSYSWTPGVPASGSITGAHDANEVITLGSGWPSGLSINSAARTWAYDGTGTDSTGTGSLIGTHPQATNSPHTTSGLGWTIASYSTFTKLAAVNSALATSGVAVIAALGDSTTAGYGTEGAGSIDNAADKNPTHALSLELQSLGFNTTIDCYSLSDKNLGDGTPYYSSGHRIGIDGNWTYFASTPNPWGGGVYASSTAGANIDVVPRIAFDTVEIFYHTDSGFGDLAIDVGGGTPQTVSTAGSLGIASTVLTFPLSTGTVHVKCSSGFVNPLGLRLWNSTTDRLVIIDNFGNAGWRASDWLDNSGGGFSPFAGLLKLKADAFIINLGLNEQHLSVSAATYKTNLKSLATKCLSADAPGTALAPDVLFAVPTAADPGSGYDLDSAHRTSVIDACSELGLPAPLNLYTALPYATYSGEYSDGVHFLKVFADRVGALWSAYV